LEHPNVLATLRHYGPQGFDVVGITWDRAVLQPTDSVEVRATKTHAVNQLVNDYAKKHGLTWPSYVDAKTGASELTGLFRVSGVPSIILLDRSGKVVDVGLRGAALNEAVKAQLERP
jgi:hypothetical protein